MNLEELEKEIIRLEDIQEIEDLQKKYGYYMDSHHRQEVVDLFSENTESLEIESVGLFLGKERAQWFCHGTSTEAPSYAQSQHFRLSPSRGTSHLDWLDQPQHLFLADKGNPRFQPSSSQFPEAVARELSPGAET